MKRVILICTVLFCVLTACRQDSEKIEMKHLENAIKETIADNKYQWVVILPGLGCHGCIQEGEFFMSEHITDNRILFVLTKISSLKILQQKMDIRIDEHSNIFVDRNNIFTIPTDNRIYPCVVRLKEGKISDHSFQSPQNAAFYQLEQQLK